MADSVMVIRLDFPSFPISEEIMRRTLAAHRERVAKPVAGATVTE